MSDWPVSAPSYGLGEVVISPFSALSLGPSVVYLANNATPASTAWGAANRVLLIPFRIPVTSTAFQAVLGCGATAAGNFLIGIYDWSGNLIVSSSSTAKVAAGEVFATLTDTVLLPGRYWLALQIDGTSNVIGITAANAGLVQAMGIRMASPGSFALPDPVTFQSNTGTLIPTSFGLWMTAK